MKLPDYTNAQAIISTTKHFGLTVEQLHAAAFAAYNMYGVDKALEALGFEVSPESARAFENARMIEATRAERSKSK